MFIMIKNLKQLSLEYESKILEEIKLLSML